MMYCEQVGYVVVFGVFVVYGVVWIFGCYYDDIDVGFWFDQVEMYVQVMGKGNGCVFVDVVMYVFFVGFGL